MHMQPVPCLTTRSKPQSRTSQGHKHVTAGSSRLHRPLLGPAAALNLNRGSLPSVLDTSSSSCDALDSEDFVYAAAPLRHAAVLQQLQYQRHQQQPHPQLHLQQLSLAAAEHAYPWIASAYFAAAAGLLAAPQHAVQMFGGPGPGMGPAHPLLVSFAQLLGGAYLLQGAVAMVVKGCAERGQLHGTTCQRMLLASLLSMTGNVMSLVKVAYGAASAAPGVWLAVLLVTFCAHVACHLPHHPWFLVKVLWPVAVTMALTDILQLLPAVMAGSGGGLGTGRVQALLAALLSVKAISRLSRFAAGAAPRVAKRFAGPVSRWVTKCSAGLLPILARRLGRVAPKITRVAGRIAGRMAPRYAKDQLTGTTMHMAFHDADRGMTQTVAKSIDLLPPKTPTAVVYTLLLAFQLAMIANAYYPSLLIQLSLAEAVAAEVVATTAASVAAETAAVAAASISDPLLRMVKYAWGSGFFVAAFACNCLKTAADRHHSWAPQNRQLAAALGAMQAVTAWVLYIGLRSGAVMPGAYTWCSICLAALGATFCCYQAATASSTQQWAGSEANSAAGSVLQQSMQGDAQQLQLAGANMQISLQQGSGPVRVVAISAAAAAAVAAAAAAECRVSGAAGSVPLSSAECEKREHAEPEYAAFTSAAVLLLTLLQLAL